MMPGLAVTNKSIASSLSTEIRSHYITIFTLLKVLSNESLIRLSKPRTNPSKQFTRTTLKMLTNMSY